MITNKINIDFLKKINPQRVTFFGILLWLFFFLSASMKVKEPLSIMPVIFIVLNYFTLFIGFTLMNKRLVPNEDKYVPNKSVLKKILWFLIIISLLGFIFRLIDKFVIREIVIGNTTVANRRLLAANKPSIFGIAAAILTPFSFLPLFIYHFIKPKIKILAIFCGIIFFLPAFDNFVLGSRSGIFMVVFFFMITIFYYKLVKVTPLRLFVLFSIAFVVLIYTTRMFIERTKEYMVTDERAIKHILTNAVYNYTLEPSDKARENIINTENDIAKMSKLSYMNMSQYYTHGVFEFGYLYKHYDAPHHYGGYMFGVIAKFTNLILGTNIDLQKIQDSPPRTGIYTSFFGPLYVDFGWLAPIFMFLFGLFQGFLYNKVVKGNFKYIPLLFYMLIIDFFMPVINFIVSSQGTYIIASLVAFIIFYKILSSKLIVAKKNGEKQYYKVLK